MLHFALDKVYCQLLTATVQYWSILTNLNLTAAVLSAAAKMLGNGKAGARPTRLHKTDAGKKVFYGRILPNDLSCVVISIIAVQKRSLTDTEKNLRNMHQLISAITTKSMKDMKT